MDSQQGKSALIAELGLPPEAKAHTLSLTEKELGRRWKGYRVTLTGLFVSHSPGEIPAWPSYKLQDPGQTNSINTLQIWRQVVAYENSPTFGEVLWHPEDGVSVSIKVLERLEDESDFPRVWQGLLLLSKAPWQGAVSFLALKRKRRPKGSGKLENLSPTQFRDKYKDLKGEYRRGNLGLPKQEDMAAHLDVGRTTIFRYLKKHGIQWPPA